MSSLKEITTPKANATWPAGNQFPIMVTIYNNHFQIYFNANFSLIV